MSSAQALTLLADAKLTPFAGIVQFRVSFDVQALVWMTGMH
jgi:hypothetical protein